MNVSVINELVGSHFVRKVLALITSTCHMLGPVAFITSFCGVRDKQIEKEMYYFKLYFAVLEF